MRRHRLRRQLAQKSHLSLHDNRPTISARWRRFPARKRARDPHQHSIGLAIRSHRYRHHISAGMAVCEAFLALAMRMRIRPGHNPSRRNSSRSFSARTTSVGFCYSHPMTSNAKEAKKLRPAWKAMVEICFIIFLFYSNLFMGEFTRANGRGKSLAFAVEDIFSFTNFVIAVISGLIGYLIFDFLRKRL